MFKPIIIKLDYSPRDERHSKQVKSVASRLGKRIGSGLIDRPNIGRNRRRLGSGRIDIPTGGVRGYKKPTGNRFDFDRDGWADEGTTNPVWVGLSSGQDRPRPIIETQRVRPKINLNNKKINERKKIRQKIKYGESSLGGKLISRKSGPKWLDGLSNEQISNILVPDSYQTYSQMLADGFGVDKETIEKYLESRWGVGKPWLEIDYSENSIKELRQALKSALDESPIFSWAVRNYGSPTYTVMTRKSAEAYNNRDAVKPLYDALKKMYPDAPGEPQFAASNHLDFEMVTFNPINVVDKKSWRTSEPISSSFQTSKLPSDSDTVIDRSIPGTILHEWAHWYHSEMLLANIESSENKKRSPKSLINPQDADFAEKVKIALEYNSDNGNMNLHLAKKSLEDSPGEPRTITSYGHVSKKEMFAEGMLAYMHPNEQLKLKAINKKLRQDIETILAGDKGVDAWKDSKANIRREKNILSSGRKNRKLTKLSSGSKTEELQKPTYPRHPSYGPFLDGAEDLFTDVKNWEEFKKVYDNLEINFFDYETTGLVSDEFQQSSGNGAPVQFGVTKTKGGKEIGRLNIFMNPGEKLGDWSRENLKNKDGEPLTDEWLSSQTSIADAHKKLIEFVGPDAIFGVQNAVFDKTVLEDALTSSGIEWRPKGWIDTKVVSDLVIPKWTKENQDAPWTTDRKTGEKIPSSSLKALTEYLGIDLGKKHHTADADAAATSELMSKIIDKAIEKKWSSDIFDKNWRDQKIKDKLENHQQKIIDFEQEKNNWISKTSPKKSTVPIETEKKEFGFGRLSSGTTSYRGRHESPDASSGAPLHNLANGAIYPEDIYGPNGANLYGGAFPDLAQKAVAIFRKLRNKPDSELTVYRAVPRGKNIKEGDWVTILPEYAKIHGDSWLKDGYEIATKKVKAKELFNEGNSLLEFGYHSKLSSGKYDGAPTYKGKVWKDRKNELDGPVWPFAYQAKQYPKDGPPGISYFKGVVDESTWVDCLLYRDDSGKLIGILNHYPFALVDPDDPRIKEKRGNFNIFIDPKHKGKGIGTKLVDEAVSRYNVDLRRQRYSEEGANFINNYIRKLPENKNKTKLSSGAPERIKDVWNGDRYIRFQTYKNMEIGFTGEPRPRDVPSGKRFVEMKVIDSVDGRLNRVPKDEARTFTEKTISAAIDWLLDRQIQTEAISSLSRRFILTEEQFKEFLAADIKASKAKPDPNKKKYPSMKKGFRVDEKELASLSENKPDNRILVQVPNRFWDDHLSRLSDDFDSPKVRGEFRTETRLNYSELDDLISDADFHIETAGLPDEEFDSMGAEQLMDALIKQGIPIENGKLKLSSGKTNRANRRANSSKLSSGSQPRMNLSDEEKREIIAIASQRTDDFSKSVVAQFRRNGKLSDRQWNALNRATLRRSRLSSGAIGVEEFKNMSDAKHAQILSEAGLSQRGEAENAGQAVWEKGFTGLYQYALEHIGDLYHRAQHRLQYSQYGLDEVDEKIAKILGYLRQPYGFEREVEEQTNGVTAKKPELTIDVLKSLGKKYADAHGKLPVYNLPAELMVKASMHLGNWEFEDAARTLEQLREMLNDEEKWKFMLSRQGTIEYLESKRANNSRLSSGKTNRANNSRLSSASSRKREFLRTTDDNPEEFLPITNLAAARNPNTDTNLQTPANQEILTKRRAARRKREKVNREVKVPLETQLAIVEHYKNPNITLAQIEKKFNVGAQYINNLARQYNLPYRLGPKSRLTEAQKANIIDAIKNGMSHNDILKKFNITRAQLGFLKFISEPGATRELRLNREKTRLENERKQIIKLFNEGLNLREIKERINKPGAHEYVYGVLKADKETGPKLDERLSTARPVSEIAAELRAFLDSGGTIEAASKKFNLSRVQIERFKSREKAKGKPLRTERIVFTKIIPELIAFLEKGGTYDAAAEKFNLSRKQIVGLVKRGKRKGKIPKTLKARDKRLAPAGRNVEIAEYYAQGATIKELSEMFELSEKYIDEILRNQKKEVNSKLSSGKTNRANRRANSSKLSSGSTEVSEMAKQRIQRRIAAYKEEAEKGDGSELKLPWDKDGKLKEKPIIVSEVDDDFDDDEELSKEEKENRAAALEYAKISLEEMAERTRRAEESKRRLNSPEYLEQARLRRVARNKGQETTTHNADGTIKR